MAGLYVHIPFCRKRCNYCSFVSFEGRLNLIRQYISCLKREAVLTVETGLTDGLSFDTVYFGGGTPSLLPADSIPGLIDHLLSILPVSSENGLEISFECNPESVHTPLLHALRKAGVNRMSLGIQDLTEKGLSTLGRIHSVSDAKRAARKIREFGFKNLSLDIIYGLPGQDAGLLERTLTEAVSLCPTHVSAYELTVEKETRLYQMVKKGRVTLPSQDERLELTRFLETFLEANGINQYEISNFATDGFECRHNVNYWKCGDYLGLGCGAVSFLDGTRYFNTTDITDYMKRTEAKELPVSQRECLDRRTRFRETFVMSLRMTMGVELVSLKSRFQIDPLSHYGGLIEEMCQNGLMEMDDRKTRLKLTERGRYISNYVLSHFV